MPYRAPVADLRFLLDHVAGYAAVTATDRFAEAGGETADAILAEAARLSETVLAPLNRAGDLHPARLENGIVRTSPGYAEGYAAIAAGGWVGMTASPEHGGMGLPVALASCVNEMMGSACLALQLGPVLTLGQIEALEHHASDELKRIYLPRLISGEWSGTMNLTEPQAGSDVGALRTRAEPAADGTYRVTGQKIFISWGDADFLANVCHLVLARLPDGAPGTAGISLFMVPKYLPDAKGNPGEPNSLRVVSLEHKMGLHGSPTAVMEFDGATGWLVGEEHAGIKAMFTMMNNARLAVGIQGISAAEGAFQHALAYARDRRQGRTPVAGSGAIVDHADVRRMLAEMKAEIRAARGIALMNAAAIDMARATGAPEWSARAALLTPISKAFGTDTGVKVAEMGVQVHGGMGFIEETGAAQFYRDVRVTAIYEGTNGIQAMDLVGRKMADGGEAANRLLDAIEDATQTARARLPELAQGVWEAVETLRETTDWIAAADLQDRFAGATAYLAAFARVLGGHIHLACAAAETDAGTSDGPHRHLAAFYIGRLLPEVGGLSAAARAGVKGVWSVSPEDLAG